ncbi:MAG: CDP-alcohol phosphatidyltransferase family protein [Alphaproteobacteria bacterium]
MRSHFKTSFIIPNAITLAGTCSALTGIKYAMGGLWEKSVICIILAAIFDGLDGRAARMLKATSTFGEILDSLSDFVAFGVAPAFIMYFWILSGFGGIGWGLTLFFVICCGLRLARFNTMLDKLPKFASNFFQGIPAPAGALVVLLPIMVSFYGLTINELAVVAWFVFTALLMVSTVPMFSFKKTKIERKFIPIVMLVVGLILAGLASKPWYTLSAVLFVYLLTIPFSYSKYKKLEKENS